MSRTQTGPATDPEIREWSAGFSWIAHPAEGMRRASHALASGGEGWLVDPVDFEGLDDRLDRDARLPDGLAGVAVLLDRHARDAAAIARRHDVAVHLPAWMDGVDDIDAPVRRFERRLGETAYRARKLIDNRAWQECALWDGDTLVVPEAVGTADFFRARGEPLGVHPVLRLLPPRRQLGDLEPERVLTGHGMGVFEDASPALSDALAGSRRRAPALYLRVLRGALPV